MNKSALIPYKFEEPATLLYASVAEKTIPKAFPDRKAKYTATFALGNIDAKNVIELVKSSMFKSFGEGANSQNCHISFSSGKVAAENELERAKFKCKNLSDVEAEKVWSVANLRAETYKKFAGVLRTSTTNVLPLSRLDPKTFEIAMISDTERMEAQQTFFYSGAKVMSSVNFQCIPRQSAQGKDIVTCYLDQVLFIEHGERLPISGGRHAEPPEQAFKGYLEKKKREAPDAVEDDFDEAF